MSKTRNHLKILIVFFSIFFLFFTKTYSARAISEDNLYKRALLNSMYNCFNDGEMYSSVIAGGYDGFVSFEKSILKRGETKKTNKLYIPTSIGTGNGLTEQEKGTKIGCRELFLGDPARLGTYGGTMTGLFDLYNKTVPEMNSGDIPAFLQNMGYTSISTVSSTTTKSCINLKYINDYNYNGEDFTSMGSMCWTDDQLDGTHSLGEVISAYEDRIDKTTIIANPAGGGSDGSAYDALTLYLQLKDTSKGTIYTKGGSVTIRGGGVDVSEIKSLADGCKDGCYLLSENDASIRYEVRSSYSSETIEAGDTFSKYEMGIRDIRSGVFDNAYKHAREFLSGKAEKQKFSDSDKYTLYNLYLQKVYQVEPVDNQECQSEKPSKVVESTSDGSKYFIYTSGGWCRIKTKANINTTVSGFTDGAQYILNTYYNFEGLIEAMGKLDTTKIDEDALADPSGGSSSTTPPAKVDTCSNSGGAANLGWIVCSVLDWMGEATTNLYTNIIEPNLKVQSDFFDDGGNAQAAWGDFRDIANVLFIVLILIVIFSQVTGYGIDNYGIKKILPKLIIAAVLINLSFLICTLCVDLSNIIGNGLQQLFNGFSFTPPVVTETYNGVTSKIDTNTAADVGVVSIGLASVAIGAYAIFANPALLLSLLVSVLGLLIAVLFMFILLAGRKAAIVVLAVVSPVMFLLYILPNTKKIFDKWLNLWKAMLLLYPICGLLIGGGNFASRLVLSVGDPDGGAALVLTALVIGILPIFFVPMLLKSAFAAMGAIGSKISGFGDSMRSGATSKIRNAEGYKNAQKMGLERRTRVKGGLDKDGNLTKRGELKAKYAKGIGRHFGADKRQAAYIAAARKNIGEEEAANASLTNALSRSAIAANGGNPADYYSSQFESAAEKGDITAMNAAIAAAVSSGYMKDKDIAKMIRTSQGKIKIKDPGTKAAWMRDTATKYGNGFLGTDFEMKHWMQNGGSATLGNFGSYAASGAIGKDDIKPEDITKLSGDSLAGLAQAGVLTPSMAQQVMAENPNISADKRIMLGAIASGAATVGSGGTISSTEDFKKDALDLLEGKTATRGTINASVSQAESWAAPTPESVVIQDVKIRNIEDGSGRQSDTLKIQRRKK